MARHLDEVVTSVRQPHLAKLLGSFFGDAEFKRLYLEAPAAKRVHHAYLGGLAEHSLEVAELVLTIARFSQNMDRDLAVTAALLHDLGKIKEYSYRRVIDLTDDGRLVGHTVLGYHMLLSRIGELQGFPQDLAQRLLHAILAHHGQMEWGAPVVPQTVEAAAVHHADLLSSRIKQFDQLAAGSEEANARWSAYDSSLGRSVLLPRREAESE
jgi:3'-5' exoribonuclease